MPIPYELSEIDDIVDGDTVAIDLETYDPELKTHGSGAIKGVGKVCGIALACNILSFSIFSPDLAKQMVSISVHIFLA